MPIKEYENYSISSMGRVWSAKTGILKTPIKYNRLFEILKEMRDISALAYKKINTTSEN
jgi:hypothetical protein